MGCDLDTQTFSRAYRDHGGHGGLIYFGVRVATPCLLAKHISLCFIPGQTRMPRKKAAAKSKSAKAKKKEPPPSEQQDEPMGDGTTPSGGPAVEDLLSQLPENRFELELEFIQSLASPAYLHYLATSNFLTDPAFLAYLKYLQYWREPPYNRFLTYPHCLTFLDLLLTNETFRRELNSVQFRNFLHEQQFYSWQYRSRHLYGGGGNDNDDGVKDSAAEVEEGVAAAAAVASK